MTNNAALRCQLALVLGVVLCALLSGCASTSGVASNNNSDSNPEQVFANWYNQGYPTGDFQTQVLDRFKDSYNELYVVLASLNNARLEVNTPERQVLVFKYMGRIAKAQNKEGNYLGCLRLAANFEKGNKLELLLKEYERQHPSSK
jgi:hypothetical protein